MIFVTEDDHAVPSTVTLEEDDEEELEGLINANGEINWDCPCLQGMAYGPCGEQFKSAFSCFHYSEADPKGSDCIPQFRDMQECFVKYPEIYGKDDDDLEEETESTDSAMETNKTAQGAASDTVLEKVENFSDDSNDVNEGVESFEKTS